MHAINFLLQLKSKNNNKLKKKTKSFNNNPVD